MRVLVLNVDALRPDYLGPYGCEWVSTPTLDRWAAAGVVYDWHFADSPDPAASASWRTGRHPLVPGPTGDLLTDLRTAGVRTARVGPPQNGGGWEIDVAVARDGEPLMLKPPRRALRKVLEQLGDAADALVWLDVDAMLPPWAPSAEAVGELFEVGEDEEAPEPWTDLLPERVAADDDAAIDRLQRTYAAAVASFDASLDRLLVDCAKRGWGDDATWVLTAGRGFPLGEHGAVGFAAADLHEELAHLPLLVRRPHADRAGERVATLTQPADVGAQLRSFFGLPGGDVTPRDRAVIGLRRGERVSWGYRTSTRYLLLDDRPEGDRRLFVKPDDRWEVNDVRSRNLDLVEELEAEFREYLAPGQ